MGLLSKVWKSVKKLSNFLGLGIPNRVSDWMKQDVDNTPIKVMRQGSNNAIPVIYGRQKVGGTIVHKYVTDKSGGADNDTLHLIVAFAEGFIEEIEEVFFDDVSENDPKYLDGGVRRWINIHRYNGGQIAADPLAVENIPNWTEAHKMSGLAYCYIELTIDKDHEVWRGEPQITAIIKGLKVYDPRTGNTEYSTNPALCLRDYLTDSVYGKGLDSSRIDDDAFITAANFCDELVTVTETLTESYYDTDTNEYVNADPTTTQKDIKRFTCNLSVSTSNDILANVKAILGTFRGILPPDYIMAPIVEREESIIDTIDEDDVIGALSYSSGEINDRFNSVSIKYNAKLSNYEAEEATYPDVDSDIYQTWLEEDGGRQLEKSITFEGIDNKAEALQMAEIIAKISRFGGVLGLTMQARGIQYQVGDVIGVNSETFGWADKPFRVREKTLSPDGEVALSLSEHENSVYPWANVAYDDRTGGTYLGNPSYIPAPQDFDFVADLTFTTFGRLIWRLPTVDGVEVTNSFIKGYQISVYKYVESTEGGYILDGDAVFSDFTISKFYDLPIFGLGEFVIEVKTISTLGFISEPAAYFAEFKQSVKPYELQTEVGDWDIFVKPVVYVLDDNGNPVGSPISLGIGATFEFDWIESSELPYEPESKAKGATMTISGCIPETAYTVYARSFSATGVSDWISKEVTTTATGEQVNPFLDPISQEIEDANDKLDGLQQQVDNIEIPESQFEFTYNDLIDQVSDNFWNELTNYERKEDIKTETIERVQSFEEVSAEIETVNGDVSAVVTRVDEVEVKADGTAEALALTDVRVSNAEDTITAQSSQINQVEIDVEGNATAIAGIGVRVDDAENDISAQASLISQAQSDIEGNAQATNALQARVEDNEADIVTQAGLLQDVQIDADNNAIAITQIDTRVTNNENGVSANASFIQQVDVKADGNASSITELQTRVTNTENDIDAQANLIQDVQSDVSGNATAITDISSRVTANEDFASAQVILNAEYDAELDEVTARAYFGVNVNDRVTGIYINGSTTETDINFVGDKVRFIRPDDNTAAFYWDNSTSEFLFDGKIIARDSTFTGTVTASTVNGSTINGGSINGVDGSFNTMAIDSSGYLVFGAYSETESRGLLLGETFDPTYVIWIGKGARNDTNADFFIKRDGTGFIKGDFFQGEIIATVSASAQSLNNNLSATTQTYTSAGKNVVINYSAVTQLYKEGTDNDPVMTINTKIYRGTTLIDSIQTRAQGVIEPPEAGVHNGRVYYSAQNATMFIDTSSATGSRYYRVENTYSGITSPFVVTRGSVAISAQEDKLA